MPVMKPSSFNEAVGAAVSAAPADALSIARDLVRCPSVTPEIPGKSVQNGLEVGGETRLSVHTG